MPLLEHKGGCMFFNETVFAWIDRAQWNKLVWRGIYGKAERRVQKGFSFVREEICVAITKNMVYRLLGHVALTRWCLEEKNKKLKKQKQKQTIQFPCMRHLRENLNNSIVYIWRDSRFSTMCQKIWSPSWH